MPGRQRFAFSCDVLAAHLEAEIDSKRSDWRLVPDSKSHRTAKLAEIDFRSAREHVASIDKSDDAKITEDGNPQAKIVERRSPQLCIEDDDAAAADRKSVLVDRLRRTKLIER